MECVSMSGFCRLVSFTFVNNLTMDQYNRPYRDQYVLKHAEDQKTRKINYKWALCILYSYLRTFFNRSCNPIVIIHFVVFSLKYHFVLRTSLESTLDWQFV